MICINEQLLGLFCAKISLSLSLSLVYIKIKTVFAVIQRSTDFYLEKGASSRKKGGRGARKRNDTFIHYFFFRLGRGWGGTPCPPPPSVWTCCTLDPNLLDSLFERLCFRLQLIFYTNAIIVSQ